MTNNNNNTNSNSTPIINPYLSGVDRSRLDFDFERRCSVTLLKENVYACLTCGNFFVGRGVKTPANVHALEETHTNQHKVFLRLEDGRAFCLPENYEILDKSLDDVRNVLKPKYEKKDAEELKRKAIWAKSLDGTTEYLVGCVGLNAATMSSSGENQKAARGVNAVVQALARVDVLRDAFLLTKDASSDSFPYLMQKMWNRHNFRGHTSPDIFVRTLIKKLVVSASDARKTAAETLLSDPFTTMRHFLTFVVPKKLTDALFRGELLLIEQQKKQPFTFVPLKLPDAPLFRDVMEKNAIPQVALTELLKPYALHSAPKYLLIAFTNRFSKNQFTKEVAKNPTIVTFPVKNLKLAPRFAYDLIANVDSSSKATVRHVDGNWYEIDDLVVSEILAQQVTLGEAYVQIYQRV